MFQRMGGGRRKFPEGAIRINYLHQARQEVLHGVGGHLGRVLAASLGQHMSSIGKKSQIRLNPEIKQKLCKVNSAMLARLRQSMTILTSGLWRNAGARNVL